MPIASLQRGNLTHKCPGYDTKLSDGEVPVLELWGMWNIPSLKPGVVIPVRVPSMGQIELFNHLQYLKPFNCSNKWELSCLKINLPTKYLFTNHILNICMNMI